MSVIAIDEMDMEQGVSIIENHAKVICSSTIVDIASGRGYLACSNSNCCEFLTPCAMNC